MQTSLFPYETVRDQQDQLITAVHHTIDKQGQLVVHAPTGLGKTAATLAPAIERAITNDKIVVFMTSRLTQHALALDTVARISARHNVKIPVVDMIGKKHMCLQPGVDSTSSKEFAEYCKSMREQNLCEYYGNMKTGEQQSAAARGILVQLGTTAPNTPHQVKTLCNQEEYKLCPYEVSMLLAKKARVIITDYSYMFNPRIREGFLKKIGKELSSCIIIVDEGHNLPERVKELATERVSNLTIRRALSEMKKTQQENHKHHVEQIGELLNRLGFHLRDERYVTKEEIFTAIQHICPIEQLIDDLHEIAKITREEQKTSSCGVIADFLTAWSGEDIGFTRILSKVQGFARTVERKDEETGEQRQEGQQSLFGSIITQSTAHTTQKEYQKEQFQLSYRCLDPSMITKQVFDVAHSTIIMSGTLTPTHMYAQLLGTTEPDLLTLASPFPLENRLSIIIPKTTTKFTTRSPAMYKEIATICQNIIHAVPGNSALFFPSYQILNEVKATLETSVHKTVFTEHPSFTREEREEMLQRFKTYKHDGAALLGVMGGSFSEGIDLPGDELRCVVIIGLPLSRPDLETKALIDYYQLKFGKGWEYGYTFPAFNKTLQSAGRCIRSETDRGIIVFIDERYAWKNYYDCFPQEWNINITMHYEKLINVFFNQ